MQASFVQHQPARNRTRPIKAISWVAITTRCRICSARRNRRSRRWPRLGRHCRSARRRAEAAAAVINRARGSAARCSRHRTAPAAARRCARRGRPTAAARSPPPAGSPASSLPKTRTQRYVLIGGSDGRAGGVLDTKPTGAAACTAVLAQGRGVTIEDGHQAPRRASPRTASQQRVLPAPTAGEELERLRLDLESQVAQHFGAKPIAHADILRSDHAAPRAAPLRKACRTAPPPGRQLIRPAAKSNTGAPARRPARHFRVPADAGRG